MLRRLVVVAALLATTACASTGVKRPYSAFDVAQSYPRIAPLLCCREEAPLIEGDSHKAYLPKLVAFAAKYKIEVQFHEEPLFGIPSMWGINLATSILIRSSFPLNTQVATLAHELGHSFEPDGLTEDSERQLFAETVSIVYCQRIGLAVWQSSYIYFGKRNTEEKAEFIRLHAKAIDAVVNMLLAED